MADYVALWMKIDGLMRERTPRAFDNFCGPAEKNDLGWLHALARSAGTPLDAALEATYRAHDGAKGTTASLLALLPFPRGVEWAALCEWHSLHDAREELAVWRDALDSDDDESMWSADWLPIARDGGGNAVIASLSSGELYAFDHEDPIPVGVATLGEFLVEIEKQLSAGTIGEDDDGELEHIGAAARAPRIDPVETLMALLVEKNLAAIKPTPELKKALAPILDMTGKTARTKRFVALLYDHPDVEEVFADDDVLEVFLDEFG
jgi:cell wall assembly regulator SMI1